MRMRGDHTKHLLGLPPAGGKTKDKSREKISSEVHLPSLLPQAQDNRLYCERNQREHWGLGLEGLCKAPALPPPPPVTFILSCVYRYQPEAPAESFLAGGGGCREQGRVTCLFIENLFGARHHAFGQGHRWVRCAWALIPALLLATWSWPGPCSGP